MIDLSTEAGQRADRRLRDEAAIWLTTVDRSGQPQTSPVWFLWDGETFLIFSMPRSPKVPNVRSNPHVSLNLDGGAEGEDVVTIEGRAEIPGDGLSVTDVPEYVEKYRDAIAKLGSDPDSFAGAYSVPIRVTPTRARVWS